VSPFTFWALWKEGDPSKLLSFFVQELALAGFAFEAVAALMKAAGGPFVAKPVDAGPGW